VVLPLFLEQKKCYFPTLCLVFGQKFHVTIIKVIRECFWLDGGFRLGCLEDIGLSLEFFGTRIVVVGDRSDAPVGA
jgi:hypothetical protein